MGSLIHRDIATSLIHLPETGPQQYLLSPGESKNVTYIKLDPSSFHDGSVAFVPCDIGQG